MRGMESFYILEISLKVLAIGSSYQCNFKHGKMKKLGLVIVFLLTGLCSLSAQIRTDSLASRLYLVGHPEVQALRSSRETSLETIMKTDSWKAFDSSYTTTPETAIWIKFSLENTTLDTLSTYLFYSGFYMDLYLQKDDEIEHFKNGYHVPLGERPEPKWYFFTALELLPMRQSQCYIRITNNYKMAHFAQLYPCICPGLLFSPAQKSLFLLPWLPLLSTIIRLYHIANDFGIGGKYRFVCTSSFQKCARNTAVRFHRFLYLFYSTFIGNQNVQSATIKGIGRFGHVLLWICVAQFSFILL